MLHVCIQIRIRERIQRERLFYLPKRFPDGQPPICKHHILPLCASAVHQERNSCHNVCKNRQQECPLAIHIIKHKVRNSDNAAAKCQASEIAPRIHGHRGRFFVPFILLLCAPALTSAALCTILYTVNRQWRETPCRAESLTPPSGEYPTLTLMRLSPRAFARTSWSMPSEFVPCEQRRTYRRASWRKP